MSQRAIPSPDLAGLKSTVGAQESRLIAKLGLTRFGKDVLVIFELAPASRTPAARAELSHS